MKSLLEGIFLLPYRIVKGTVLAVSWPFWAEGTARERWILGTVGVGAFCALMIAYPPVWNAPIGVLESRAERIPNEDTKRVAQAVIPPKLPDQFLGRNIQEYLLGLDLAGGAHLEYAIDTTKLATEDVDDAISALRDTIERRVNVFGVREPRVSVVERGGDFRLIVELSGIQDTSQAIATVGNPIFLEFREERPEEELPTTGPTGEELPPEVFENPNVLFKPTELTGQYLQRADVVFDPTTGEPIVQLTFTDEGGKIFQEITKRNVNRRIAIYLDGVPVTAPVVQQEIIGNTAVISGAFDLEEAKELARNLNAGALPVPIELVSQRTVGATLGARSLEGMVRAGALTFILVIIFMIALYRLPGLVAVGTLALYTVLMLALFKLLPVTLSIAGIGGFILSVGMAVDANILVFSRIREELREGKQASGAVADGFRRAWPAIRDANISTLLTTVILYFVSTSFVQGFALTLGIGIGVSLFTAVFLSRHILRELTRRQSLSQRSRLW